MDSYKNYTSAWIASKGRWEVYDPEHNLVYTSKNPAEDPLHYYVDSWAHLDSTLSPPVTPGVRVNSRGFTPEQERIIAERFHKQQPTVNHPPAQDLSLGFFGTGEGVGDLAGVLDSLGPDRPETEEDLVKLYFENKNTTEPLLKRFVSIPLSRIRTWWKAQAKKHGTKEPAESGRVLGPEKLQGGRYEPSVYKYGQVLNYLDFETVGTDTTKGSILSYAAIKKAYNLDTGTWDIVSKRTRYYYPTSEDYLLTDEQGKPVYDESVAISGLTNENIEKRRREQLARYSRHFNDKQLRSLIRWLGKDPVIGHNISQFDWPKMLGLSVTPGIALADKWLPPGGLIDTLHIAEGTRGSGKGLNTNSFLFQLAYGMTPEEAGFTAHDALEDVQITALVFEAMRKSKGRMGVIARYLANHPGLSTQWRDSMINGITEVRNMSPEQQDILNKIRGNAESNPEDYLDDPEHQFDEGAPKRNGSIDSLDLSASLLDVSESIKAMVQTTKSAIGLNTGIQGSNLVKLASRLGTVGARREFLQGDFTDNALDLAVLRAGLLYQHSHHGMLEDPEFKGPGAWEAPPLADLRGYRAGQGYDKYTQTSYAGNYGKVKQQVPRSPWENRLNPWISDLSSYKAGEGELQQFAGVNYDYNDIRIPWKELHAGLTDLSKVIKTTVNAFEDLNGTAMSQAKDIYNAAAYFIPKPFKEGGDRLFKSGIQEWRSSLNSYLRTPETIGNTLGIGQGVLQGVATGAFAGPWGMLLGGLTGLGTGLISTYTDNRKRSIVEQGQSIASRINLWAGVTDILIAPLRILANAFKSLTRISLRFGTSLLSTIGNLTKLGIPLTHLTGVTYADMQRSYVGDTMIGKGPGTMNSVYNSFANAQMEMYNYGSMDTNRVIAAALTGTFGSVYGNGGDTQAQFADTANKIASQIRNASDPRQKQRLMMLAGKIDSNLPTVVQQMTNLGITDYKDIQSGAWLKRRGINQYTATDAQRARYSAAAMEYTGLTNSFAESKNMIVTRLWEVFGKDLFSGLNEIFHKIATGNWKGAIKDLKTTISNLWDAITGDLFGKKISPGDAFKGLLNAICELFWEALPSITKAVSKYVEIIGNGLLAVVDMVWPSINELVTRLSMVHLDVKTNAAGIPTGVSVKLPGAATAARVKEAESGRKKEAWYMRSEWNPNAYDKVGFKGAVDWSTVKNVTFNTPEGPFTVKSKEDWDWLNAQMQGIYDYIGNEYSADDETQETIRRAWAYQNKKSMEGMYVLPDKEEISKEARKLIKAGAEGVAVMGNTAYQQHKKEGPTFNLIFKDNSEDSKKMADAIIRTVKGVGNYIYDGTTNMFKTTEEFLSSQARQ